MSFAESYFNRVTLVGAILNLLEESKGDEKWKQQMVSNPLKQFGYNSKPGEC